MKKDCAEHYWRDEGKFYLPGNSAQNAVLRVWLVAFTNVPVGECDFWKGTHFSMWIIPFLWLKHENRFKPLTSFLDCNGTVHFWRPKIQMRLQNAFGLNFMQGLKSAILAIFQNGLGWPCPVRSAPLWWVPLHRTSCTPQLSLDTKLSKKIALGTKLFCL